MKKNNKEEIENNQENAKNVKQEINGPKGLEPTRYGNPPEWEKNGRVSDF